MDSTSNNAVTWVEVSKQAIFHNLTLYKNLVGHATMLAPVIKSNAYGHGITTIAQLCDQHPAVEWFCTVSLSEAIHVRLLGIKKPILVLGIMDEDLARAVEYDIDLVAYDKNSMQELQNAAKKYNKKAFVHIKVDTGLSRLGNLIPETIDLVTRIQTLPNLEIRGIFTHFSDIESGTLKFAQLQLQRFHDLLAILEKNGKTIPVKHISCSAALTVLPQSHYSFARLGIALYGLWPSCENKDFVQNNYGDFHLQPVLTWKTKVIQVKEIPALSFIGYDRTYVTTRTTKIAILPVGYWDGYNRLLSNNGYVIIHNQRAPIRGRIAMNMTMVDVTDFSHITSGDEVTLLGPGITADDLAQQCSTISYEIVTRINPLLQRIVV